jgi:hypothetical protein
MAVIPQSLLVQCCPWVGEVRQLLSHWDQAKRNPALALDKPEGYRKITPIAAPIVGKPEQASYFFHFVCFFASFQWKSTVSRGSCWFLDFAKYHLIRLCYDLCYAMDNQRINNQRQRFFHLSPEPRMLWLQLEKCAHRTPAGDREHVLASYVGVNSCSVWRRWL